MKNIITTFLLLLPIGLYAQFDTDFFNQFTIEDAGKCFQISPLDSSASEQLYLEITPPIWKNEIVKTEDLLIEQGIDPRQFHSQITTIQVSPASYQMVVKEYQIPCCEQCPKYDFSQKNTLVLCVVEVPACYETISFFQAILNLDTFYLPHRENIIIKKLVQPNTFRLVSATIASQSPNTIIKLYGGNWDEWRRQLSYTCADSLSISKIQKALKKLGYEVENDGVLGSSVRKVLVDFQRKNGLPIGRLDIEILKALEAILNSE